LENPGQNEFFTWSVFDDDHPWLAPSARLKISSTASESALSPETLAKLDWLYPFRDETKIPAKVTVSELRREMTAGQDEDATRMFAFDRASDGPSGSLSAAEIGSAHHIFLEHLTLERAGTVDGLRQEAERLRRENQLTTEQSDALDLEALAAFWQSDLGRELSNKQSMLRRELAFTVRLDTVELARMGAAPFAGVNADEFVVVQGIVDLAAILADEIWLLDFKTDHFPARELNEKVNLYRPQIELYAAAISRIHQRPVTQRWLHFLTHRHTASV
jgi:ATP-dependent helicase/nuclease subunit A